jgi:glycosyltransferase involved in cell wall biosynthesis
MSSLDIVMLTHNIAWKGGAFYHAYGFARQLARRGHKVSVVAIAPEARRGFSQVERDGVCVIESPDIMRGLLRSGWDPWDTYNRTAFLRRMRADIVHCVDTRPAVILPALWAHDKMGARLVTDWTDWFGRGGVSAERPGEPALVKRFFTPIENYFEENFHHKAAGTITISTLLLQRAYSMGIPSERLMLIRPGCDVDRLEPRNVLDCRRVLGLDEAVPIVGFLGALALRDDQLLLEAMACVCRHMPQSRLLLIGNHRLALSTEQRQSANVIETSFVPAEKMSLYLGACNLLVLPLANSLANRARWPSKVNDYLSVGRSIVATDVGDVAGLLRQYGVGRITQATAESLGSGLLAVLADKGIQASMGTQARRLAENELSWPVAVDALEKFYQDVL